MSQTPRLPSQPALSPEQLLYAPLKTFPEGLKMSDLWSSH